MQKEFSLKQKEQPIFDLLLIENFVILLAYCLKEGGICIVVKEKF